MIVVAAPLAERLFDAPQLERVLTWLAIPVVLSGAGNTHMALRLREFGHKTLAYRSVLAGFSAEFARSFSAPRCGYLGIGPAAGRARNRLHCARSVVLSLVARNCVRLRRSAQLPEDGIDLGLAQADLAQLPSSGSRHRPGPRSSDPELLPSCLALRGIDWSPGRGAIWHRRSTDLFAPPGPSRGSAQGLLVACCSNAPPCPYPRLSVMRLPACGRPQLLRPAVERCGDDRAYALSLWRCLSP